MIRLEELDYALPPHYIAQHPREPRDTARLLVYRRSSGEIQHSYVAHLAEFAATWRLARGKRHARNTGATIRSARAHRWQGGAALIAPPRAGHLGSAGAAFTSS